MEEPEDGFFRGCQVSDSGLSHFHHVERLGGKHSRGAGFRACVLYEKNRPWLVGGI